MAIKKSTPASTSKELMAQLAASQQQDLEVCQQKVAAVLAEHNAQITGIPAMTPRPDGTYGVIVQIIIEHLPQQGAQNGD